MAHTRHVWAAGDTITHDLLNTIETDLAAAATTVPAGTGIVRAWQINSDPTGVYDFPCRLRPYERRRLVRVLNLGANAVQIAYGSTTVDNKSFYSNGAWTWTLQPGQEWVDSSQTQASIFMRGNANDSLPRYVAVYTEVIN